jgi:hypothetical protein
MGKKIFVPAFAAALFIGGGFTGSIDSLQAGIRF